MATICFLDFSLGRRRPVTLCGVLALVWLVLSTGVLPATGQSQGESVAAQIAAVTPHLEAYGQIEPGATLTISFPEAGYLAGLVLPGAQVQAGQELAHLNGADIRSMLLRSQRECQTTRALLSRSRQFLAAQQRQLSLHRTTRQAVYEAERAVIRARTSVNEAQSQLRAVRQMITLRAPVAGTVLMINATNGELISASQPILTLQTPYRLWLNAAYYGADLSAIRAGMTGMFSPADGSGPVPVRVCAVSGLLTAGGGASIIMARGTPHSRWIDGEFGTVMLNLPQRLLVAVPTRSLILDQGEWWVMVRTPHGDRPKMVVPGPTRGWLTFLEQGLNPGAQVVVENAYLLFHRDISQRYQPPD